MEYPAKVMSPRATPASPPPVREADAERWSSLCNCVVNFLLQEGYLLTAFELLHELTEDGRHDHAIRLRDVFADKSLFPPDQISRFNALRDADPQTLLEEKIMVEEKLAISGYELRLAQEDLSRMTEELQKQTLFTSNDQNGPAPSASADDISSSQLNKRGISYVSLGPLKDTERKDLNCAVKEYLLFAGYCLTTMTFLEEVTDQNLDVWSNNAACVPDALRRYYHQYLLSTSEDAEEKIAILQTNESLLKENKRLDQEKESILKSNELANRQIVGLTKSLEAAQKDLKEKDILAQDLRKQLNDCRAEITALKMHIEGARGSRGWTPGESENIKSLDDDKSKEPPVAETKGEVNDNYGIRNAKAFDTQIEKTIIEINEVAAPPVHVTFKSNVQNILSRDSQDEKPMISKAITDSSVVSNGIAKYQENARATIFTSPPGYRGLDQISQSPKKDRTSEKMALQTIQIVSDALPKIVPYVLINHREELLPLIMCAIEHHPDSTVRDSLTHTLFNLIKKPDEQQRRIIMDACVSLAKNVGDMRTETELLPQCWEQINHKYEERRLLVAQSCGELAEFVRPEICDSLILSIVQQLIEDSAIVVREAAAHNLALLLPLFPNLDKYFKVEKLMFQLVCDPSGSVVDATLQELVPAVIKWGGKLEHILRVVLSNILGTAQRCPPVSGVEASLDSHLRVLGEGERWNIDVLLRMLTELLTYVHHKAIETCPFSSHMDSPTHSEQEHSFFSASLLQLYAGGHINWPTFDWMHVDCFPDLIQLACFLSQKEDDLRKRITKYLLNVSGHFGDEYLTHIMLPVFLVAVGDTDSADLTYFPSAMKSRIKGLRPKTVMAERLALICVLPLMLSGILGNPNIRDRLSDYLRKILVHDTMKEGSLFIHHRNEVVDAVRFLCIFKEHHGIIFNVLWEMVVSSDVDMKSNAAALLKVLVPHVDVKVASTHALPALVTLGSDQNLNVKHASIDAFGVVAQHFKSDVVVDKIRVQMDAFLEEGLHEATVSVIRALALAVPHTTNRLREYLLSKIFQLASMQSQGNDKHRREKVNVLCEAVRALDATDLPAISIRDFLLPAIQNLLKDHDALDPAHKEALEIILKERSDGTFEGISKVMGTHLGITSSVSSFFGESGFLGKKDSGNVQEPAAAPVRPTPPVQPDDTRFRRIMRANFGGMLGSKAKGSEESPK